jgi:hypothetical protein
VGAGAAGTRDALRASLSREVGAEAPGTRGTPGAALSREVGAGAPATRGAPEVPCTRRCAPEPQGHVAPRSCTAPFPCPSVRGQGVVVPVTGFRVVPDHLVLTAVTPSPTPSPIPSSAHSVLTDPHWRVAMEKECGALINNGT